MEAYEKKKPPKSRKYIFIKGRKIPLNYLIAGFSVILALILAALLYFWLLTDSDMVRIKKADEAKEGAKEPALAATLTKRYFMDIPHFIVTVVNDTDAANQVAYFKIAMSFELESEDMLLQLAEKMPRIRDSIVNVVTNKKVSEINITKGKLKLKDEIRKFVNSHLQNGQVTEVYFTEFVYQF